jgi:hypothetical protein
MTPKRNEASNGRIMTSSEISRILNAAKERIGNIENRIGYKFDLLNI